MALETAPTVMAALITISLGLAKIVEVLVVWLIKKIAGKEEGASGIIMVQLAPEVSQMIREVHATTTRTSNEGVPLVYGPRQEAHQLQAAMEAHEKKYDDAHEKLDDILEIVKKP